MKETGAAARPDDARCVGVELGPGGGAEREADAGALGCADRMELRERCFDESQRGVTHRVMTQPGDEEAEAQEEFITVGGTHFLLI